MKFGFKRRIQLSYAPFHTSLSFTSYRSISCDYVIFCPLSYSDVVLSQIVIYRVTLQRISLR